MTINQYLDELQSRLAAAFPDPGRQMTVADLGRASLVCSSVAADHGGEMKPLPYDSECEG